MPTSLVFTKEPPVQGRLAGDGARQDFTPRTDLTLLVAEDDGDNRLLLKTWLELRGYRVVEAANGEEALRVLHDVQPDLILMDLQLPLLNGFVVTRHVRQDERLRGVPIVIVSGHDPAKHRNPALAAGCQDFLTKPVDFRRLEALLKSLLPAARTPPR